MQKVKLYTIQEQEVLAYDRVRYFSRKPLSSIAYCEDKVLECAEVVDVPVRHIRKAVHTTDTTSYEDYYLAIEPKLHYLLRLDVEQDIKKHYQLHIQDLKYGLANYMAKTELLEDRVDYYNKLPWYKRMFQKV